MNPLSTQGNGKEDLLCLCGQTNSREAIRPFFEWFGIDMATACDPEVQQHRTSVPAFTAQAPGCADCPVAKTRRATGKQGQLDDGLRDEASLKGRWRAQGGEMHRPMHTGQFEGLDKRIQMMKRMADAYRGVREDFFYSCRGGNAGLPSLSQAEKARGIILSKIYE